MGLYNVSPTEGEKREITKDLEKRIRLFINREFPKTKIETSELSLGQLKGVLTFLNEESKKPFFRAKGKLYFSPDDDLDNSMGRIGNQHGFHKSLNVYYNTTTIPWTSK